jgi:hypothetical protein
MNDQWERMSKEALEAYFEALSQNSSGGLRKTMKCRSQNSASAEI